MRLHGLLCTFVGMKKRSGIINLVFAIAVLFAVLFQSFHSFEHLAKQFTEKKCHHAHKSVAEITHQHHNFDHCGICDFTFSSFVSPDAIAFHSFASYIAIPYYFSKTETPDFYSGSSHSRRGPPVFIA